MIPKILYQKIYKKTQIAIYIKIIEKFSNEPLLMPKIKKELGFDTVFSKYGGGRGVFFIIIKHHCYFMKLIGTCNTYPWDTMSSFFLLAYTIFLSAPAKIKSSFCEDKIFLFCNSVHREGLVIYIKGETCDKKKRQ
jgi:hypothetical protein